MTITLRPFQQKLEADVYAGWNRSSGPSNMMPVAATGSGKTVLFSKFLKDCQGYGVASAHRQELVGQMAVTLGRNGVRHRILAPDNVRRLIVSLQINELGTSYYDPNARIAVAGVDSLVRMPHESWHDRVGLMVQDECFPAGTLIDGRPIESLRAGDTVLAFNESTLGVEPRKVVRTFRNVAPKNMMRVGTGAHVLECTNGHPFYTRRGWVEAVNLTLDDEVLLHELHALRHADNENERVATIPVQENREGILHEALRLGAPYRDAEAARKTPVAGSSLHDVCGDRRLDGPPLQPVGEDRPRLLQQGVFGSLSSAGFVGDDGCDEPGARLGAHESEEPHAGSWGADADGRDASTKRACSSGARWEREGSNDGRDGSCSLVRGPGVRGATVDSDIQTERCGVPSSVQTRHGELVAAASAGGRRGEPCGQTTGAGREKGRVLTWARLDRLEVFQRADTQGAGNGSDDGHVYNIEVEGLHTYIAGGIVVHNCHHVLRDNKWGAASAMFKNAYGLYVTATPCRADGKGLGRHADGLVDEMILAPSMRDIINMGYLTDYRVVLAESDVKLGDDDIGASGDFKSAALAKAHKESKRIVGDVVKTYLQYAKGKLGLTFAVNIEEATKIAEGFRAAGVPAEVVTGKTPDLLRQAIIRRFKNREILQLVSVDIFGEGFDLPAIEVVSFARHTASFSLYCQQYGRALRLMIDPQTAQTWDSLSDQGRRAAIGASVKPRAIIIDHVGNIMRHQGPPDAAWRNGKWTLDRREGGGKRKDPDAPPLKYCANPEDPATGLPCAQPYEQFLVACPHCGFKPAPAGRSTPEQVEGNMLELDDDAMAKWRGEIAANWDMPSISPYLSPEIAGAHRKRHAEKMQAIDRLRNAAAWWAGLEAAQGRSDAESHKRFYATFGTDIWTAMTFNRAEADGLFERIRAKLAQNGIDATVNAGIHLLNH